MATATDLAVDPVARLRGWIARGEVVLFTGAGFSNGAADRDGQAIPQVKDLKHEVWKLVFPDREYDNGADLGDLYQVALAQSKNAITDLLRKRLNVDPQTVQEYHRLWLSVPWRIAYTVNIDNFEAAAYTQFEFGRGLRAHSALAEPLPLGGGSDLLYVHLNGTYDEIPDVTFGPAQYGARVNAANPMYAQLITDMITYPVVSSVLNYAKPPSGST